jgi:anti-sigma factor RsiW
MTGSRAERGPMRHIPEDELHAYLDQGLSRTQCVEIESHLADCPSCRATRDGIAALRDRTTALLSRLAPRRSLPPAFDSLRQRADEVVSQRRRRIHGLAWAASLVAAVGLGWVGSSMVREGGGGRVAAPAVVSAPVPGRASVAAAPSRPVRSVAPPAPRPPAEPAAERAPVRTRSVRPSGKSAEVVVPSSDSARASARAAALSVLDPQPAPELTQLDRPGSSGELDGMWRTMSWDGAKAEAGERLPHIDGLPVVQVQVQSGEEGSRPVMVVAQQLSSGQVIRTIEGPATDVSQLLSRRAIADVDSLFLPRDSAGLVSDPHHAMAMQVGDRMLAITGDLPSDSLRAMIRRLNVEMRSK